MSDAIKADEMQGYDFGTEAPPEGFNPDATGFANPPPGQYVVEIATFETLENHTWKGKDFDQWLGSQHRPHLRVTEGEHAGKTIMDFLPIPVPGSPMPRALANRWANYLTAFGFRPPSNALVPPGFRIHSLIGSKGQVAIEVDDYDGERQNKERASGRIPVRVTYFGYSPITPAAGGEQASKAATAPAVSQPASPSVPAAPISVDLDDL